MTEGTNTQDEQDTAQLALLRAPFEDWQIGHLPRGNTTLSYVGHAAVTSRLLEVDPHWSWEPFALSDEGMPRITGRGKDAVLWIKLTVCGMTRPGVGICPADAFELEKQLISDALRNAAMRFGVALDLWSKEDLRGESSDEDQRPGYERLGYDSEEALTRAMAALTALGQKLTPIGAEGWRAWRKQRGVPWPVPFDMLAEATSVLEGLQVDGAPVDAEEPAAT